MSALLPHPSRALQRTLALSVAMHVVAVLGVRWNAPVLRTEAALAPPVEIEVAEADSTAQVAASVEAGREDRAQGDPAAKPAPSPEPQPQPRPEPEPRVPPAEPQPLVPPAEPEPEPEPKPEPAIRPEPTPRPKPRTPPRPIASLPPPSSAAPVAASSSPGTGAEPGDGGGFTRPRARDLAAAITSAIPPASDSMPAWRTLPLGDAGRVEVELQTDDEGRLTAEVLFDPPSPPSHLVEMLSRARLRTGRAPTALDAGGAGPGSLRLRLAVRIDEVAVPRDLPGGAFGLHAAFRDGRGLAHFTLAEGRRVTIEVDVVRVARAAR